MKEMQIEKEVEVEASTLEGARALLKTHIQEGMELLSEQVLSDGKQKSSKGVANTMEAALNQARSEIPSGAEISGRKQITYPEEYTIFIDAFDEESAKAKAKQRVGETATVRGADLIAAGKKGFLGIGKKPNRYEATIFQMAVAEVTFKEKVRIRATIGKKPKCERCGKSSDYLLPVQLMVAGTGARSEEMQVCDKCFTELASGAEQMRFE